MIAGAVGVAVIPEVNLVDVCEVVFRVLDGEGEGLVARIGGNGEVGEVCLEEVVGAQVAVPA